MIRIDKILFQICFYLDFRVGTILLHTGNKLGEFPTKEEK